MASNTQCSRQLLGPLLPPKNLEEEDIEFLKEDEEEEEDDSAFVDAEELCSGGVVAGSLPGRLHGKRARPLAMHGGGGWWRLSLVPCPR